jgi:transcription elongation factor GreA
LEGRILELEELVRSALIIPEGKQAKQKNVAQVGSTILVSVKNSKEMFKIVGAEEANPMAGKISVESPLGKAVLNQPKNAEVEVETPEGTAKYKILKIE